MGSTMSEVAIDVFPWVQVYKDGTINRLAGTETAPQGLDPDTGVLSKDVVIVKETGVSVRFYRPNLAKSGEKLPLVVYFHGGAFLIATTAELKYHTCLNKLVSQANVIVASVNYRLAPEHPLPAAFEDSWDAVQWIADHNKESSMDESEPWIKDYVDFDHVFLSGDSAGATIAHYLLCKDPKLRISGCVMIHPYFWGKDPIGAEKTDHLRRAMVDNWWNFVCVSDKGNEDPLINPFADGAPDIEKGFGSCDKLLIFVAEKDILRDRGIYYYERLLGCEWKGNIEVVESKEEDHVFHIFNPDSVEANNLIQKWASFINQ
ncbi:probable carboxylesterase 2 [Rutidosis leptorrhynchoides]|uniref:probable carboxylesterase 2 n=1 Tax=Rutidosis leptorrhynchoides TaxID=125765 RepID=UPI003A99CA59